MKLSDLVSIFPDATLEGDDREIHGINEQGCSNGREVEVWLEGPVDTDSPAVIDADLDVEQASSLVKIKDLFEKLPVLLEHFQHDTSSGGISSSATIDQSAAHPESVEIGPDSFIGPDVSLGENVRVMDNVTIKRDVRLDDNVTIHSGVRIVSPAIIGENSEIHSNSVIGADGFGYREVDGKHQKIPQVGKVRIGRDVEIGANVTIDRAMYGETVIGDGTKIDNIVHIGHNCKIGENCIIITMTGVSGSVTLGDNVTLAGQSGVKDHVDVADGVTVGGRGGITKDIEEEDAVLSGYPARPHREHLKQQAMIRKLPELKQTLDELENTVDNIEKENCET